MPAKRPAPRLPVIDEAHMNDSQRTLLAAIRSGPRGTSITPRGPFAVWLHAPEFGHLAQALGGHWEINFGQIYTTLARLERDRLVEVGSPRAHERNRGPENVPRD